MLHLLPWLNWPSIASKLLIILCFYVCVSVCAHVSVGNSSLSAILSSSVCLSVCNCVCMSASMTGRVFFNRFSTLFEFFLSILKQSEHLSSQ